MSSDNKQDSIIVIREMMIDRGFTIERKTSSAVGSVKPVLARENSTGQTCYAHWLTEEKLGINMLRELLEMYNVPVFLIIVCQGGATSFTDNKIRELSLNGRVSVFKITEVMRNITRHALVPKHEKCNASEIDSLMTKFNIESKSLLPIMFTNDPVARYFNFTNGDVVRIHRINGRQEKQLFYRVVVNAPA